MLTLAWLAISDILNQDDVLGITILAASVLDELDVRLDISGEILGQAALGDMAAEARSDL